MKEKHGLNVSSLYIAQIKENFNLPKSDNTRVPKCTPEKENAIIDAATL